ncbi:hypothetical protein HK098_002698 [Nowakowskiella sp. JEL0407]|nr:hypothetical protein HK098_002698 [Nowakowskiella sp. JEL0407]
MIGLLVGREKSFPKNLLARVAALSPDTKIELICIDLDSLIPFSADSPFSKYAVIVDRISHDIHCYQPFLKVASLTGTIIINDPVFRHSDDKFFDSALASLLGIKIPKTVLIPSKSYDTDVSTESFRNLKFPLSWSTLVSSIGFPMYLKSHLGSGWNFVHKVEKMEELLDVYNKSETKTLIAQQEVKWVQMVRCIVIGDECIAVLWDPRLPHSERYAKAQDTMPELTKEQSAELVRQSVLISRYLGYEMNSVEYAITEDGEMFAIDIMNSCPDFDNDLGIELVWWVVDRMARLCLRLASIADETDVNGDSASKNVGVGNGGSKNILNGQWPIFLSRGRRIRDGVQITIEAIKLEMENDPHKLSLVDGIELFSLEE